MLPFGEAQQIISQFARSFGTESVSISEALGRVLAENISADRDYPPFHRATMDGFALKAEDFDAGVREFKVIEEIFAGKVSEKKLSKGECYKIMTGASVPPSADAVIRREDVEQNGQKAVIQAKTVKYFQNIARQGEDLKRESLLLSVGTRCQPPEINALAVVGKTEVKVQKLPNVALFSTGDEIKSVWETVLPHQIRDSNTFVLEAMLKNYGIKPLVKQLIPDEMEALEKAFVAGLNGNIVIVSGGVSAGDADFVPQVFEKLGVRKVFHKVAIRPGKPFWFGEMPNRGVVFALPGNPVSCQVTFKLFIEPFLQKAWQMPETTPLELPLLLPKSKKVPLDEFFPFKLNGKGILPLGFNTSGDITATLGSDGIALHSSEKGDLAANETVFSWLWR